MIDLVDSNSPFILSYYYSYFKMLQIPSNIQSIAIKSLHIVSFTLFVLPLPCPPFLLPNIHIPSTIFLTSERVEDEASVAC